MSETNSLDLSKPRLGMTLPAALFKEIIIIMNRDISYEKAYESFISSYIAHGYIIGKDKMVDDLIQLLLNSNPEYRKSYDKFVAERLYWKQFGH